MRAGLLTEQIDILESSLIRNAYGEEETQWSIKQTTKARLMHKGGNRTLSNDEVAYQYTKTFQVRHYIMVNEYDRIQWNGKIYRILDIEPDKQQMLLTINVELVND